MYILDRPAPSLLWGNLPIDFETGFGFGEWGQWLPTFSHVVGWSLITAGGLAVRSRCGLTLVCLLWLVINAGFELGQKFAKPLCAMLPQGSPANPITDLFRTYFQNGTYDSGDLWAAGLGAGSALAWLLFTAGREARWTEKC